MKLFLLSLFGIPNTIFLSSDCINLCQNFYIDFLNFLFTLLLVINIAVVIPMTDLNRKYNNTPLWYISHIRTDRKFKCSLSVFFLINFLGCFTYAT